MRQPIDVVPDNIDILLCAGPGDIDYLLRDSLQSTRNFQSKGRIYLVSPEHLHLSTRLPSTIGDRPISFLTDEQVLPHYLHDLPGWSKQQAVKLLSHSICSSRYIACLGADTLILKSLRREHLFSGGTPIIYYNRYRHTSSHLLYEKNRIGHISRIFGRRLPIAEFYTDFIMDFTLFDSAILRLLHNHLSSVHGEQFLARLLPKKVDRLQDKMIFGEWSLYAAFVLDVLGAKCDLRNAMFGHLVQIHTEDDFANFNATSRIAHFVSKRFSIPKIRTLANPTHETEDS